MNKTAISQGILITVITLFTNLSPAKVLGQAFLRKIQTAVKKEIGKQVQAKPGTTSSSTDNNKGTNPSVTNPSNPVKAVSMEDAESNSQKYKPEEINSSLRKNLKNINVVLYGINDEQQMSFKKYLFDTSKGIYGIEKRSIGSDFIDLAVYTYLNKEELGKTLVQILKNINPKLFYQFNTTDVDLLRMTISNKPELNARNVAVSLKKGIYNEQETKFKNYLLDTLKGIYSISKLGEGELGQVFDIKTSLSTADLVQALLKIVKKLTPKSKYLVDSSVSIIQIYNDSDSEGEEKVFTKVEMEASFPGGNEAFKVYLQKNLNTNIPKTNGAPAGSYTVVVRFLVSQDGSISDVEAETKFGYGMEKEAVRVIIASKKWTAGRQNYWAVNSYKRQPITFIVSK